MVEFNSDTSFPIIADPTYSNIVYEGTISKSACSSAYATANKYSKFTDVVGLLTGTAVGIAVQGAVGAGIGLAAGLATVFGKYSIFKDAMYYGICRNKIV